MHDYTKGAGISYSTAVSPADSGSVKNHGSRGTLGLFSDLSHLRLFLAAPLDS